jgi:hypothetical protein
VARYREKQREIEKQHVRGRRDGREKANARKTERKCLSSRPVQTRARHSFRSLLAEIDLVFHSSVRLLLVTVSVVYTSPILVTLMVEALSSPETSVINKTHMA